MGRESLIIEEDDFNQILKDNMVIGIGGFITSSHPMTLIRQIIRSRIRGLTIVGSSSAGLEIDMLIAAGSVKRIIAPYVGAESICSIGPVFRKAAENKEIEVWECDEGMYYAGLRAAAQGLPFAPWRGGVGTSFPELNSDIKVFSDPIKGEPLLAVPAIELDLAIIHAAYADAYGHVQHLGTGLGDRALHRAAKKTVVQVEKIVPTEEIRKNATVTSLFGVESVLRLPYGAHPSSSPGFYLEDEENLNAYVKAATEYTKTGRRERLDAFLDKYVYLPETHIQYLETVGIGKLLELYEY